MKADVNQMRKAHQAPRCTARSKRTRGASRAGCQHCHIGLPLVGVRFMRSFVRVLEPCMLTCHGKQYSEGMMTARSIFPTVIDVRDEVLSADELKALKTAIEARRSRRVEDRARSLQGGERLTLDRETLLEPEFKPLATVIANTVSALNRHLYSMATEKLHFSRFWVNFIAAGGFHHPHQHGNETWASVFYIDGGDSEAGGTLHFLDPRPAAFQPRQGQAPAAVPPVPVKAETNRLVMFPGWLQHYVTPYEGDGERIAMAINCRT